MRIALALLGASAVALVACSTEPEATALSAPPSTASGELEVFDPGFIDASVDPCHDLYHYACGGWIKANPAPPDQAVYGRFSELNIRNRDKLHQILDDAAAHPTEADRKVVDYYSACLDESGIEAKGLEPLKPELARIDSLHSKKELPALIAHLHEIGADALFGFSQQADFKDASLSIAGVYAGGLGLPDRDYYFKTDPKSVQQRADYEAHIARVLALAGASSEEAAKQAKAVLALETALAKHALSRVQRRDPAAIYHKEPVQALDRLAPHFGWAAYIGDIGAPHFAELNISEPDFVKGLDGVIAGTSLPVLKTYLRWQLLHAVAPVLSKAFVDENFTFYGKNIKGTKELEPRWRRCINATDSALGEALGKLYVEKLFGPAAKERMEQMIGDLRATYAKDLEALPWMGEETKKRALEKLQAMVDKIGYPAKWRDYSALEVKHDDALGNAFRAEAFETRRQLNKIGQPVDRGEWSMSPPTVNAYYSSTHNDINFPAGILQPHFFSVTADDSANYGGIGTTIGHEMTHGFDDKGREFDKNGNLNDWWTKDDAKNFESRVQCLSDQAGAFVAVDDVKQNGQLTLGENTADNGGVHIAYAAYKARSAGQPETKIAGYTPDQRFFLTYAQNWCTNMTPEAARLQALTNPHPMPEFRVNGVVSNMAEFAKAFNCPAEAMMNRGEKACRVW